MRPAVVNASPVSTVPPRFWTREVEMEQEKSAQGCPLVAALPEATLRDPVKNHAILILREASPEAWTDWSPPTAWKD